MPRFVSILSVAVLASLLGPAAATADDAMASLTRGPAPVAVGPGGANLLSATLRREWQKVDELLQAGENPQQTNELGLTPLMAAAIAGHAPTVKSLLDAGVPPAAMDIRGRTALSYALALGRAEAISLLLDRQPTLPAAANGGDDLAAVTLDTGDRQLIETILPRLPGGLTWTPTARIIFSQALAARDTAFGSLLLSKYAGPPTLSENSQPTLAYAVARGDVEQVRALLEFGADPDTVLNQSPDPLFREWISSNYVKYYMDSTQGISVLMLAAGMKQTECVKALLERGANRLAVTRGKARLLALYFAAWADCPENLQLLIPNSPSKDRLWIDISIDEQRARFYRDGQLVLTATVSTGRPGFGTRPGEYVITDKHREHRSTIYREASMPYFMRLSCRDFGLHQGIVSSRFASHGCIRLPGDVANRLFKEVPVGTWVSIRRDATPGTKAVSRKQARN